MNQADTRQRNRFIALAFVSVLLLLMYGPLAQWFIGADRVLYDQLAGGRPTKALDNGYIVTIDPQRKSSAEILDQYGQVLERLQASGAARIVLPNPPAIPDNVELPAWSSLLTGGAPVFVPSQHRLAEVSGKAGIVQISADSDSVLRRSNLWHLNSGVMSPSLALAIALDSSATATTPRLSGTDDIVFLSSYKEVPRIEADDLLRASGGTVLDGATVFVDTDVPIKDAAAVLPSGQLVTYTEVTAALLADIENGRMIIAPSWAKAMEFLIPVLFAIVAILFMPDRERKDITVLMVMGVLALLLFQAMLLVAAHTRIDLGRAILMFLGVGALSILLIRNVKRVSKNAFKRGADFLSAGRLEPAFAEFRRCNPSETVSAMMYKLSLAFEQQAKPERAEAVLDWMKRTHVVHQSPITRAQKQGDGVPQRLGRYVVEKSLGRGAMGAVYLAKDPRINRAVAVKAIPIEEEFEDEELKEARLRFYREAESAGRLTHPNIITVFDAGEDKGLAYIAMEYVPGIPLRDFTDPNRLLAPKRALELAAQAADALDYAHNQGVVHRDIKPANLLYIPKEGVLKISDFGVARLTDNNRTKTGIVLGTPMYMSPEQLGAEKLTGQSDLFSLGVTLYELLVGEVPFKATNIAVLMTKITSEEAAPVSSQRSGIPPSVDTVLAKAMAKNPGNRFSCGAEMAIALRNCVRIS
ncbi:MAG: protein kinase [Gammaproteobacteria bacterium]|nr:protein kinase [Gammaproteobacteria bacterium]NNF48558.1 protein kinase [Woeseiaceae bacterium]MBT8095200.1 protein kinase [Gammaproteobacteria bacterium]MBT8105358.1 protein kinase [Gammaproteobacteria bacterium]NNK25372.1 protein kinase [Woeseiaceae bacterium]